MQYIFYGYIYFSLYESESHSVMSDYFWPPWTLCNPMDYKVHAILQARILEWVAFSFSRGSSQPRDQTQVSCSAGGFFTNWAIKEALFSLCVCIYLYMHM